MVLQFHDQDYYKEELVTSQISDSVLKLLFTYTGVEQGLDISAYLPVFTRWIYINSRIVCGTWSSCNLKSARRY